MSVDIQRLGKYRGTVVNNVDPKVLGRLQVQVLDVDVTPSTWALPCLPLAGMQMGLWAIPPIGAGVWVEFEQGDTDFPIWTGCWYGSAAEVPALSKSAPPPLSNVVVQTVQQNSLMLSDAPGATGGILLKSASGAVISINDTGITISNGKGAVITMVGNSVDVNGGALTVI